MKDCNTKNNKKACYKWPSKHEEDPTRKQKMITGEYQDYCVTP